MAKTSQNEYMPDYVSPPGGTLLDIIESLGMSQAKLSLAMGQSLKTINNLINGKAALTEEMAVQLEHLFGLPAHFWNQRERNYRDFVARGEEPESLEQQVAWLAEVPVKQMIEQGWLAGHDDVVTQLWEVLDFFDTDTPRQWRKLWRDRLASVGVYRQQGVVAAWLRQGEVEAEQINCEVYNEKQFLLAAQEIAALTTEPLQAVLEQVVVLCALSGVAVVLVPTLPTTRIRIDSASLRLARQAMIQLNPRCHSHEQLWNSFFDAANQLLKQKRFFLAYTEEQEYEVRMPFEMALAVA